MAHRVPEKRNADTQITDSQNTFYSRPDVDFSRAHYDVDFKTQGTLALGETVTMTIFNSTTYAGPVYVLTGQEDALFCGNGSRLLGTPDCGSGATSQLAALKVFYPAVPASKFDYYAQPNSGHTLQQHYTATSGFAKVRLFHYHPFHCVCTLTYVPKTWFGIARSDQHFTSRYLPATIFSALRFAHVSRVVCLNYKRLIGFL